MIRKRLFQLVGNKLAPSGIHGRLSILIYHRVLSEPDEIFPQETTAERFDLEMAELKSSFNVLKLSEAIDRLKAGSLPARAACVTFDDGYADNLHVALPILQKHNLVATFFIATSYLDGGRMFNDTVIESVRQFAGPRIDLSKLGFGELDLSTPQLKANAIGTILKQVKYQHPPEREQTVATIASLAGATSLPQNLMMSSAELRRLHGAGMEIGGHTSTHPILARLDDAAAKKSIGDGKDFLEGLLGERIKLFAYPNGKPGVDYLPAQARIVQNLGFEGAVTTQPGASTRRTDPYQLPRFTPWKKPMWAFTPQLLQNLANAEGK